MNESKIPTTFSSLNNDVIPDEEFLKTIENYKPKLFIICFILNFSFSIFLIKKIFAKKYFY